MLLGQLLKSVKKISKNKCACGICFDSRKVKKIIFFLQYQGNQTSGIKFINEAILNGASAIVCDRKVKYKNLKTFPIIVKDM